MKSVYLAGRYSRRLELDSYAQQLRERGWELTSQWLTGLEDDMDLEDIAVQDMWDVKEADVLIAFTEPLEPRETRGGRHVELGMALAWGKPIVVVGPRENVFCHLPDVQQVDQWSGEVLDLMEEIKGWGKVSVYDGGLEVRA